MLSSKLKILNKRQVKINRKRKKLEREIISDNVSNKGKVENRIDKDKAV